MKISTRGRYALRLMLELCASGEQAVSVKQIAKNQQISEKYLEQIIPRLARAGLVASVRGAQGGYRLTRTPAQYPVGEILRLAEGSLVPADCVDMANEPCQHHARCATQLLYQKISQAVDAVVDGVTLADLIAWQQQMDTV